MSNEIESLDSIFNRNHTDKGSAGHNFAGHYESILGGMRLMGFNLLEVGIQFGFSAKSWLEAFPLATIYGVDCGAEHHITDPRFHFQVGNQRDAAFWAGWKAENPRMYVIIDDAEHRPDASRIMFECLWPHLHPGGFYVIEDTCTWFDPYFSSGGTLGPDWMRDLFCAVNWHGKDYGGKPGHKKPYSLTDLERTVESVLVAKHICILKKRSSENRPDIRP